MNLQAVKIIELKEKRLQECNYNESTIERYELPTSKETYTNVEITQMLIEFFPKIKNIEIDEDLKINAQLRDGYECVIEIKTVLKIGEEFFKLEKLSKYEYQ